jgi:hypothetical protein
MGALAVAGASAGSGPVLQDDSGQPYTYSAISWDRVGEPVLDKRSKQPIVGNDGRPMPFAPAFPLLKGDSDPLLASDIEMLRGLFPGETEARVVYGNQVRKTSRLHCMVSNYVRVLPVALRYFDSSQGTNHSLLMAGSVLMMLPMILLFIFGQRFFVRGMQLGALKG